MYIHLQYCIVILISLVTLLTQPCIGNTHLIQKRAPPFVPGNDDSISNHLSNYTHSHEDVAEPTYSCTPISECDICTPFEQKSAPYCQEYGNKERVRCEWDDPDLAENVRNQTTVYDYDAISLPTYRGCSHVKRIERWKFIKFETINILVAVLSVSLVLWRQRKLAREQYQRLAQRIGVPV